MVELSGRLYFKRVLWIPGAPWVNKLHWHYIYNYIYVTVGELKKCGKFETVLASSSQSGGTSEEKPLNTLKFSQDPGLYKWKGLLYCIRAFVRNIMYRRELPTNYCGKEFCWDPLSSFVNLYSCKKDPLPTIFNFPMESHKPVIGQNPTKNKQIIPSGQRAIYQVK